MTQFSASDKITVGDDLSFPSDRSVLDLVVLEQVLSFGDATTRKSLLAQLLEDFQRLGTALHANDQQRLAAVAHELKGLSATIGAYRLSGMAEALNNGAERFGENDRALLLRPLLTELDLVQKTIRSLAETVPAP